MKLGRFPFLVEAWRVNWLTTKASPSLSRSERFIFPFASSKILILIIFRINQSMSLWSSEDSIPSKMSKPGPISEILFSLTETEDLLTLCNTIRTGGIFSTREFVSSDLAKECK